MPSGDHRTSPASRPELEEYSPEGGGRPGLYKKKVHTSIIGMEDHSVFWFVIDFIIGLNFVDLGGPGGPGGQN